MKNKLTAKDLGMTEEGFLEYTIKEAKSQDWFQTEGLKHRERLQKEIDHEKRMTAAKKILK